MANDFTYLILPIIEGALPAMRRSMALTARIYNHNRNGYNGQGTARWTKWTANSVETKTAGTQLTDSIGDTSVSRVDLTPSTHKVTRMRIEDSELSVSSVRNIAAQQIPRNLIALVNTIESAIAAKQSSITTNRIGTLGGGISQSLLVEAIQKLEEQEAIADTLCVSPAIKAGMLCDDDILKLFTSLQAGLAGGVGNFVPNVLGFGAVGVSNQIYSPDTGQYACLAFQRECIGIAFGDLSGAGAGAGRFVSSITDTQTGITFRVIQLASHDGLGQVFAVDVQYDIQVQQEEIGCVILS